MQPVFGAIVPHPPIIVAAVGGARANVTIASLNALAEVRDSLHRFSPEAIFVMSPHAPGFADAFAVDDSRSYTGDLSQFGDSTRYTWPGDPELATELLAVLDEVGVPAVSRAEVPRLSAGELDHATIVPLSFIEPGGKVPIVVLSLSYRTYSDHRAFGEAAATAALRLGRRTAFVASGDLSHRLTPDAPAGYSPLGKELDAAIVEHVRAGELDLLAHIDPELVEAGGECGLRSFIALGGYCGMKRPPARVLSYEGPWGVGYLTALIGEAALASDQHSAAGQEPVGRKGGMPGEVESEIVTLARQSIESYVRHGETLNAPVLDAHEYPARAGTFVSLHRGGQLRGCIGTILPTRDTLAREVVGNAIEAATRDPRFPPLDADELDDLDIKVDVLHEPEACEMDDLDARKYGVITSSGWRRGLLLPDLDGVEDAETQVRIAMSKAGINPGESCSLERFRVERYT